MINKTPRQTSRKARHARVRKKVFGTADCPRMAVYRSGKHIYAQFINDESGATLAAASSLDQSLRSLKGTFIERARQVGELAAERASERASQSSCSTAVDLNITDVSRLLPKAPERKA